MDFFIFRDGKQEGPISLEKMYDEHITADTMVWHKDLKEWMRADSVPELAPIIAGSKNPNTGKEETLSQPVENISSSTAEPREENFKEPVAMNNGRGKKKCKGCLIAALIAALIIFVMFATNPTKEEHWAKITSEVGEAVVEQENDFFGLGGALNSVITEAIMAFGKNFFTVEDYVVCSVGKINYDGEPKVVSLGLLNHVFTFEKEDVTKYLEENVTDELKDNMQDKVKDKIGDITSTILDQAKESAKKAIKEGLNELFGDDEHSDKEE